MPTRMLDGTGTVADAAAWRAWLDLHESTSDGVWLVLAKKGVTYKNVWFASSSEAGKFTSELFSYPTTYVVDKNGNIVGDPIVGAITSPEQQKTLSKLIDQAIANSEG